MEVPDFCFGKDHALGDPGGGNRRRMTVVADNAMVDGTPSGDGMTLRLPRVPSRNSPAIGEVARSTGNPDKVACIRVHRTCGT